MKDVLSLREMLARQQSRLEPTVKSAQPGGSGHVLGMFRYHWSWFGLGAFAFFLLSAINASLTTVLHAVLMLVSLINVKWALKALFLLIMIKFFNPGLLKYSGDAGLLFWVVLFAASGRIILGNLLAALRDWWILLLFSFVVFFSSLIVSRLPIISSFKVIVFLLASLSCLTGFSVLNDKEKQDFVSFCITFIGVLIIVSLPTFFVQGIGFLRNGRGFQGLLNHPQVFGVFMAPLMAFLMASLMKIEIKKLYLLLPVVAGLGLIMVTTQARTSLLSVLMALVSVYLINLNFKVRKKYKVAMGRTFGIGMALIFIIAIFLQFNPDVAGNVKNYVYKNRGDEIGEAFYRSRGAGVEHHFNNFLESPLVGNGFGVFAKPHPKEEIIYVKGIPISASTEKGIVLFAVLEETGLIGFFLFSWFIFKMGQRAVASQDARFLAMFFSCLYVNFGEAVFFSPGGIGLYFWVLLGISTGMSLKMSNDSNSSESNLSNVEKSNDRILANIL